MCASGKRCQNADEVDDSVRPRDRIGYSGVIKHVGLRRFERLGWTNRHSKTGQDGARRRARSRYREEAAARDCGR
jgi:hypothetical protein